MDKNIIISVTKLVIEEINPYENKLDSFQIFLIINEELVFPNLEIL
tara:strand:- start:147 stop:284 length:138 start_codon:yes stop_codon:yes gene_type:complete